MPGTRHLRPLTVIFLLGVSANLPACATVPRAQEPTAFVASPADSLWVRDEIYFGSHIRTGGEVSAEQWEAFLDREVTPRFPSGSTSLEAAGRYRYEATGQITREPGHILILIYPSEPESEASVIALMEAYKIAFAQESVLRVTSRAFVRFYD